MIRLTRDEAGHISGVVERVKTGQKVRVEGLEAIGQVIAGLVASAPLTEGSRGSERNEEF